jgi:hypothetical protein
MAFAASNTVNALFAAAPRTSRRTQRRASPVVAAQSGKAAVGPEAVKLGEQFGFTGVEVRHAVGTQGRAGVGERHLGSPVPPELAQGLLRARQAPLRPKCSTETAARDGPRQLVGTERGLRGHSARVATE